MFQKFIRPRSSRLHRVEVIAKTHCPELVLVSHKCRSSDPRSILDPSVLSLKTRITNVVRNNSKDGRLTLSSRTFPTSAMPMVLTASASEVLAFFHNELENWFDQLPSLMMLVGRYHVVKGCARQLFGSLVNINCSRREMFTTSLHQVTKELEVISHGGVVYSYSSGKNWHLERVISFF